MASPPVPLSSVVFTSELVPQLQPLHPVSASMATQQSVDVLLALPPECLWQTLQVALNCTSLDEAATS